MTTPNELEEAIKGWTCLKCTHCGKLNPMDVVRCIYCGHIIGRRARHKAVSKK